MTLDELEARYLAASYPRSGALASLDRKVQKDTGKEMI